MLPGTVIELPVLPERISVKQSADTSEKTVLGIGAVNLLDGAKLRQISFGSFFPAQKIPSVKLPRTQLGEPMYYVRKLRECMESKEPLRFILLGADLDINIRMSVEGIDYSENYGEVGSIEYSLTLKEYREIRTRQVKVDTNTKTATVSGSKARVDNSSKPKTYTVVYGDCLWNLAKKFYGSGSLYTKIYEANKSLIGPNPNILYVGWILSIPD